MKKKIIIATILVLGLFAYYIANRFWGSMNETTFSQSPIKSFKKTKNKCDNCSCSGYWGIKYNNGTYEGNCTNTDNFGHRCGHDPKHHGLRKR